jgi:hypothetical protein
LPYGRYRRLQLVGPDRGGGQRSRDEPRALGDGVGVPPAAVLFRERDQGTVKPGPGRAAGIGEQHQLQAATCLVRENDAAAGSTDRSLVSSSR